jgi:hypothetical protein
MIDGGHQRHDSDNGVCGMLCPDAVFGFLIVTVFG